MSSDLSIKIEAPVNHEMLVHSAARIFKELLNVDFVTPFCFMSPSFIGLNDFSDSVPEDFGYGVYLLYVELDAQPPWITTEAGTYAFVDASGIHALPFVIAASVALAIAYEYNTNIIDDGSRWVRFPNPSENGSGCSANIFQLAVANRRRFSNLELAAAEFYKRLPVSVNPFSQDIPQSALVP